MRFSWLQNISCIIKKAKTSTEWGVQMHKNKGEEENQGQEEPGWIRQSR